MDSGESFCDLCTRLGLHDTPLIDIIEEIDRLRTFIAEKDREIERLKSLVADLTVGCMDNVEVKDDSDG